jgi:hypothetical protein
LNTDFENILLGCSRSLIKKEAYENLESMFRNSVISKLTSKPEKWTKNHIKIHSSHLFSISITRDGFDRCRDLDIEKYTEISRSGSFDPDIPN